MPLRTAVLLLLVKLPRLLAKLLHGSLQAPASVWLLFAARHSCLLVKAKTLSPQHVPSLTSLGLGRCAGLRLRPHLLCPSVVHQFLFQAARDGESSAEKHKRSFLLQIDHLPPPLWRVAKLHRRIVGKQSFNLVVAPKPKRVVRSHKEEVRHVVWTPEEVF